MKSWQERCDEYVALLKSPVKSKGGNKHKRPRQRGPSETPTMLLRLYVSQTGMCYLCGRLMKIGGQHSDSATLDHVVARSAGGRGEDNYRAACKRCNNAKGNMSLEKFLEKSKL